MAKATMKLRSFQLRIAGKRRLFSLGRCDRETFNTAKARVTALARAKRLNASPDPQTADWVVGVDDELHGRLVQFGLVTPRAGDVPQIVPTLKAFLDDFIAGQRDLMAAGKRKARTLNGYEQDADSILRFFEHDRDLSSISAGDVDAFVIWLQTKGRKLNAKKAGFADATVGRRLRRCSQFFRAAVRKKLIADNQFVGIKGFAQENEDRWHYVSLDDTEKLIDAAPDCEWRLLIGLARYAGMRTPSEPLALRWADVDLEGGKFVPGAATLRIWSPKTERHKGKAFRVVPLTVAPFNLLVPLLEDAKSLAADELGIVDDAAPVITRYRNASQNLRTQLRRIIKRAGLVAWERTFQNLRASCANDLVKSQPSHRACRWMGHRALVSDKHYQSLTADDYKAPEVTVPNTVPAVTGNAIQGPSAAITAAIESVVIPSEIAALFEKYSTSSTLAGYPRQETNTSARLGESRKKNPSLAKDRADGIDLAAAVEAMPEGERGRLLAMLLYLSKPQSEPKPQGRAVNRLKASERV